LPYALLLVALIVFGFFPRLLTDKINPSADVIVKMATGQQIVVEASSQLHAAK
jgi:hypothetical protein